MASEKRGWRFFRAGGVDQVQLRDGADLMRLEELDPKLWVALAMPTRGVELEPRTLDLLDTDKDGRVRVPEILAALKWVKETLKDPNDLLKGGDSVPLASIQDGPVLAGGRRVLVNLGKADAAAISIADVADTAKIFAATRFNGDGVVPADCAEDAATRKAIEDLRSVVGSVPDRSGKPGLDKAKLEAFFTEAKTLCDWSAKGDAAVLPLGDRTADAAAALKAVASKVDDYFTRCRLSAFDPRAAGALNGTEAEFQAMAAKELALGSAEIARLPLARIEAGRPLPLGEGLNPAWAAAVAALNDKAITKVLGLNKHSLSETDWAALKAKLAPFEAWMAAKPATAVEKLGLPRVKELLDTGAKEKILSLIEQDLALEAENAQIASVEKLVLFQRDLHRVLVNFVNFAEFYGRKKAVFQAGTLFLDGRSCDLCVQVADPAKHAALAGLASTFLAYCDCARPGGEKMTIAAAFTDGDAENLIVGRNGVFYDRKGRDWDATITKIVSGPISVREAFWAPYKKLVRMVEEQIGKRAAAGEAESHAHLATVAEKTAHADKAKPPEPKKVDVGTVAAIGVAIGGIGAMVTGVLSAFFGLGAWMPVGLVAALLLVSGPSMVLAWLKLRQRNLGPILDANGWAINGRARINVPFGAALTQIASLPAGAERSLDDPYAEKQRPWKAYAAAALLVLSLGAWYLGRLDGLLPSAARSTTVLGTWAPALTSPAPVAASAPETAKAAP